MCTTMDNHYHIQDGQGGGQNYFFKILLLYPSRIMQAKPAIMGQGLEPALYITNIISGLASIRGAVGVLPWYCRDWQMQLFMHWNYEAKHAWSQLQQHREGGSLYHQCLPETSKWSILHDCLLWHKYRQVESVYCFSSPYWGGFWIILYCFSCPDWKGAFCNCRYTWPGMF